MKYLVGKSSYEGTPQEIADLIKLLGNDSPDLKIREGVDAFPADDFVPLVDEAAELRKKLAEDPSFNPYPGVSKSPENEERSEVLTPSSELDTGVELK